MAEAGQSRTRTLAIAVLLVGAGTYLLAQSAATGSLTGKLTDLHSVPQGGARVVLRNEATGAETSASTATNGAFSFPVLDPGEYTMEADSPQLGHGRLQNILVSAGHEARVQTAMQFEISPPRPLQLVFDDIPPQTPLLTGMLQARPLQTLHMTGQTMPGLVREPPPTQTTLLATALPAKLLQPALLAALPARDVVRPPLQLAVPAQIPVHAAGQPTSMQLAVGETAPLAAMQSPLPRPSRVQTASQQVDPAAQAVTTTVTAAELQALPVSGRRWQEFVLDTPAAPAGSSQPSLRGAGQQPADTAVDGASIRLAFGGAGGSGPNSSDPGLAGQGGTEPRSMGQVWAGGRGFGVSEAAIREVRTAAGNAEARAARAAGGSVNVETQRGANELHGQGFLFDRQNTWGARNPFTQWVRETASATATTIPVFTPGAFTPPDHEITWGIGLGSRIRRDKLFWFAAFDSYRRNDPGLATVKHPDEFFAQPSSDQMLLLGAQLGSGSDPLTRYSQMLETLDGLLGPAPRTAAQWVGFGRIDWEATERHRFTFEAIGATWDSPGGGLTRVSEPYGNHSFGSSQAGEEWLLARWEAFLTPNLLAVTQGSAGRDILSAHAETPSSFEQTLNQNVWGQLPQIAVDSRYGFTIGNPARFGQGSYPDERLFRVQESVDWVRGGLLVKAGFDVGHNNDNTGRLRNQTGTYYYADVENFVSDALAFHDFGLSDALDKNNPHNCDETGKVWRDSAGKLRGLGNLPCYSYYSQTMGPANWHVSTNDWAGYATAQWQPNKLAVLSAGLRWEREQLPPPISALANSELPLTAKVPDPGNSWGPRLSLAIGDAERHWPVLRLGYGMYYGRIENATLETALTHTGSFNGDLNFFLRPTDNLNAGGAPPFPYVFAGEPLNVVKPGAVEFAPRFRNPEVHQAVAAIEEALPGRVKLTASALLSLGRRLPVSIDTNFDSAVNPGTITYNVCDQAASTSQCAFTGLGPIKARQITVPFYATWPSATSSTGTAGRLNPDYQQIVQIMSRANSTYEAAMLRVTRYGRRGLTFHARYTYGHAMDWNPNESTAVGGSSVLDPADFSKEYGTSNLDVRHSAAAMVIYDAPWKLHNLAGRAFNGWMLSGIGDFRSGLPYTMRTSGSLPKEFEQKNGDAIAGLGPGMNGSGGDNRVYGVGSDNIAYNMGRNTFRYPSAWKADLRLGKRFDLGPLRQLELLAETFNLFNHQNVTELETTGYYIQSGSTSGSPPTLNFLTGLKANTTAFGQPLNINATNFYRERQLQFGLRLRF